MIAERREYVMRGLVNDEVEPIRERADVAKTTDRSSARVGLYRFTIMGRLLPSPGMKHEQKDRRCRKHSYEARHGPRDLGLLDPAKRVTVDVENVEDHGDEVDGVAGQPPPTDFQPKQ